MCRGGSLTQDHYERDERGSLIFSGLARIALVAVVVAVLLIQGSFGSVSIYAAAILTLVLGALLITGRPRLICEEGLSPLLVDALAVSLLIHGTGGVDSPFVPLYLLAAFGIVKTSNMAKSWVGTTALVLGYLIAVSLEAGDLEVLLSLRTGVSTAAIALTCAVIAFLGTKLRLAREEGSRARQMLATERAHAGQLTTLIAQASPTLALLGSEEILRWVAETVSESLQVPYVHVATADGQFHQTVAGSGDVYPSWWHPTIQRIVLWSCRTGETIRSEEGAHDLQGFLAVPIVDEHDNRLASIVIGGDALGSEEERLLGVIAVPAARALVGSGQAPAGRDPVSGLPNEASLRHVLTRELDLGRPLTVLVMGLESPAGNDGSGGLSVPATLYRTIGDGLTRRLYRVFRYHGNMFVILLGGNDQAKARASTLKVRKTMEKIAADFIDLPAVVAGFTVTEPGIDTPESLLQRAVDALAEARTARERMAGTSLASEENHGLAGSLGTFDVGKRLEAASFVLMNVIEVCDPRLAEHCRSVSRIACLIGASMSLRRESMEALAVGALLHDVGKVGLPDAILRKPDSLTPEERVVVEQHPVLGARILRSVAELSPALPAVKYHHERYDGDGYPDGLRGDHIPLVARIVFVADAFDSMTRNRPYRLQLSEKEALEEILRNAGTQFDPFVVEALKTVMDLRDQRLSS